MVIPHFMAVLIFAFSVSIVFALTTKENVCEQLSYGLYTFLAFCLVAIGFGWLMRIIL
jgi:hypothetical protein